MEWIRLIGIAIIVVGFILKFDTIATVVLAGLVTALVSGVSLVEFLEILGKEFSNQRVLTIFMVTLPLVGLSETFGLKQRSIDLIRKIKGLTVGNFYTVYFFYSRVSWFLFNSSRRTPSVCQTFGSTYGRSSCRVSIR